MKKGIIVYHRADFELNKWYAGQLIKRGAENNLDLSVVFEEDALDKAASLECELAIVRTRNSELSEELEKCGIKVFNSAELSKIANDKWETYSYFKNKNIPMMYTQKTRIPYPFVLKRRDGHGGREVFFVENKESFPKIKEKILKIENEDLLRNPEHSEDNNFTIEDIDKILSEKYIYQLPATTKGLDLRIYVLGDVVLTSMERSSTKDFRANFSLGGDVRERELTDNEMKLLSKVTAELPKGFFGVDFIYNNDTPVLNEIEDVVGTRMLYKNTDIDPVDEYIKWMAKNL